MKKYATIVLFFFLLTCFSCGTVNILGDDYYYSPFPVDTTFPADTTMSPPKSSGSDSESVSESESKRRSGKGK